MPQVGSAWIQVTPSLKGFNQRVRQQLRRELAGVRVEVQVDGDFGPVKRGAPRAGQEAGGEFAQSFRRRVEAALKALPDVKLNADSTDAQREIAGIREELRTLSEKTVGIDIDAGQATAKISQLKARLDELGREHTSIDVGVDIGAASAQLSAIESQASRLDGRRVNVDVDVDRGGAAGGSLTRLERQALGLASSAALLGPVFGSSLGAATFGALGLASALGAASAGVGALIAASLPALMNVTDAVKATEQAEKATATSAITTTRQRVAAAYQAEQAAQRVSGAQQQADRASVEGARRVQDAQRDLADTRRDVADRVEDANERVEGSERALQRAHDNVRRAQEDLTRAREDAIRTLQDLREQTSDLARSEEGAEIALIEARQELAEVNRDATATQLDRRKAALTVAEAEDRLSDVQRDQRRTRAELNDAERVGVNGSRQVLDANVRLRDASEGLADARRASAEAQEDLVRAEVDGARAIADAERRVSDAQVQAAQANADASRAVSDALAAQAQQAELANLQAENGITANRNLAYQLGLLTPLQRQLYDGWFRLRDAFEAWTASLEPAVIPLFLDGMLLIEQLLPRLTPLVLATAGAFSFLLARASRALESPFWRSFFDFLARNAGPTLIGFGLVLGNVAKGFAAILMAFEPMAQRVTGGLVELSERFRDWAMSLDAQSVEQMWGRLSESVGTFVDDLVRLWEDGVKPLLRSPEFKDFFRAWEDFHRRVWDKLVDNLVFFLEDVAPPLLDFLARFLDVMIAIDDATGGAVSSLAGLVGVFGLLASLPGAATVVKGLTAALSGLGGIGGAGPLAIVIAGLIQLFLWTGFVMDQWGQWPSIIPLFTGPIGIAAFVLGGLIKNLDLLKEKMGEVLDWVRDNWKLLPILLLGPLGPAILLIIAHWDKIKRAFQAAWHWIRDEVLKKFGDYWHDHIYPRYTAAREFIGRILGQVKRAFQSAWHWIRDEVLKPFALYWEQRIYPKIRAARDFFGRIWKQIRDTAGAAWNGITDVIRGAVNVAIRIINKIIGAINRVASGLGINVEIRKIEELRDSPAPNRGRTNTGAARASNQPQFHAMGTYDMRAGSFVTDGPRAIVGEGRRQYPEAVIATDPQFRPRNVGILNWAADQHGFDLVPRMASGGTTRPRGPGIAGLYPPLSTKVAQLVERANGAVHIVSGWRDSAQQARLYHEYLAGRGNLAARPGTSRHEGGNAVDLGGNRSLYTRLAQQLGLIAPVSGEPWHWEQPGQGREGGGGFFSSVGDYVQWIINAARGIGDIKLKLVRGAANWIKNKAIKWAKDKALATLGDLTLATHAGPGTISSIENQVLGKRLAASRGWDTGAQWEALMRLVMSESGWSNTADNPTSTAYGIGQFLDSTWATVGYRKTSDPRTQILAMYEYIARRYGNPINAWRFKQANNYYAMGGVLPPFLGSYQTGTDRVPHDGMAFLHRDEAVLDANDAAMFRAAAFDSIKGGRSFEQHNSYYGIVDYDEISRRTGEDLAWLATVGSH